MSTSLEAHIPCDRRRALRGRAALAEQAHGSVLFADVCGFTRFSNALLTELGERPAAERLAEHLNAIYETIIPLVHRHDGSVISFNGDAITCFFAADDGRRALRAAFEQHAHVHRLRNDDRLASRRVPELKISVAAGGVRRFAVGDPGIQRLDVIAGTPLERMAGAERCAQPGEVVASEEVIRNLGLERYVDEWRLGAGGVRCASVPEAARIPPGSIAAGASQGSGDDGLPPEVIRQWILGPVLERLSLGDTDHFAEFRSVVAVFISFRGISYDADGEAGEKLDSWIRHVQHVLSRAGGHLLKVTVGDKGSYLLGTFGAPAGYGNDAQRAVAAALDLAAPADELGFNLSVQAGVSQGRLLVGEFGCPTRRAYDVLGNEANFAARLMQRAGTGEVLVSARVRRAAEPVCRFVPFGKITLSAEDGGIEVFRALGGTMEDDARAAFGGPRFTTIGRDAELGILSGLLHPASAEPVRSVIVSGQAGIGKSHLVGEVVARARAAGIRVLSIAGDPVGQSPYSAWRRVLADLVWPSEDRTTGTRRLDDRFVSLLAGEDRERLSGLLPLVGAALPISIPENDWTRHLSGQARAERTTELFAALIAGAAARQPMLLVVEDAHWLDSASGTVLTRLVARGDAPPLLVTTRSEDHEARLRASAGHRARVIDLRPLEPSAIEHLVAERLGVDRVTPQALRLILPRAEGHPFFAVELALALHEAGLLVVNGRECDTAVHVEIMKSLDIPETIEAVIANRFDRFSVGEQMSLKCASVIGRVFTFELLREVRPIAISEKELREHLTRFIERGVCQATSGPAGEYAFDHSLLRDAAYGRLVTPQRKELHLRAARYIERGAAGDQRRVAALLAHHYLAAEDHPHAVKYAAIAGEHAYASYANEEAIQHLSVALGLVERTSLARTADRARWARFLGEAELGLGRFRESQGHLEEAVRTLGDELPADRFDFFCALALDVATQARARVRRRPTGPLRAPEGALERSRAYERLMKLYYYDNDGARLVAAGLRALNLAEALGPGPELARAYANNCVVASVIPAPPLARVYARCAREVLDAVEDPATRAWVMTVLAVYDAGLGNWSEARASAESASRIFERVGDRRQWEESLAVRAPIALLSGDVREHLTLAKRLRASADERGDPHTKVWGRLNHAESCLRRGGPALIACALEDAREAVALLRFGIGRIEEIRAHAVLALAELRAGNEREARSALVTALELARPASPGQPASYDGYAALAEAALGVAQRSGSNARRLPHAGATEIRRFARVFPMARPRALLSESALLELAGSHRRALMGARKALAEASRLRMPHEIGLAHLTLGRSRALDRDSRRQHLSAAVSVFDSLDSAHYVESAREELAQIR